MSQLTDLFSGIANAIRTKNGSSGAIQAANFATAIAALPASKTGTFSPNSEYKQEIDIADAIGFSNLAFLVEEKNNYQISGSKMLCGAIIGGVAVGCRCYNGANIYNDATPTWAAATGKLTLNDSYTFVDRVYRWVAW